MPRTALWVLSGMAVFAGGCAVGSPTDEPTPSPAAEPVGSGPGVEVSDDTVGHIDTELRRRWDAAGVRVAGRIDDEGYLRRVSLDLVGRVPTPEELDAYKAHPPEQRRELAVERLLASDEFVDYWADRTVEFLMGDAEVKVPRFEGPTREWVAASMGPGKARWDEMVHEALTAEGSLQESGAPGFVAVQVKGGGNARLTDAVGDLFLGVQIGCAECHDHPYEAWKREDFWALSAGFARTRVRVDRSQKPPIPRVVNTRRGETRIETEPGGPKDKLIAPALLGEPVLVPEGTHRRDAMADAVVGSPLLAKAAAGRIWADFFGRGLEHPWNDLGGPNKRHDPILELLAASFVAADYDLRDLMRTVVRTEAYQRSSEGPAEGRVQAEKLFARARVRPLTDHQLVRVLGQVTGLEDLQGRAFKQAAGGRRVAVEDRVHDLFGATEEGEASEGNVPQALFLVAGRLTQPKALEQTGLVQAAVSSGDRRQRVRFLYRTIYSREPTADELSWATASLEGQQRAGVQDLAFAMLNSAEFLTNH